MASKPFLSLRRRRDFEDLVKLGSRASIQWMSVNVRPNTLGVVRCGWTIPKRVGKAVIRNRLRRWGREILRKNILLERLPGFDVNFSFRTRDVNFYKTLEYSEFKSVFCATWNLAIRRFPTSS